MGAKSLCIPEQQPEIEESQIRLRLTSPNTIACSAEVTKDCLPNKHIKGILFSGLVGVP